jgi:hypothetical protein
MGPIRQHRTTRAHPHASRDGTYHGVNTTGRIFDSKQKVRLKFDDALFTALIARLSTASTFPESR